MYIYIVILTIILINGILFGKKRKWFVFSSFMILILFSGLRKYTVGIDLASHYANRFTVIANLGWRELSNFYHVHTYDMGFIVFDKILGIISDNPQWFIFVTSFIVYGSNARYIYKHSDNVVLETFMFITSFTMMMYLNIIAQALAISIILFGLDFLMEKNYIKYLCTVLLATSIHQSAIICLMFIPLMYLENNKKNIRRYIIILLVGALFLDRIVSILIKTIFRQFSVYFESGSYHGAGIDVSANSIFQISMHAIALFIAVLSLIKKDKIIESEISIKKKIKIVFFKEDKIKTSEVLQLPTNFLIYMSITALIFRILIFQSYIFSRMGFYVYFFSFSLMARAVANIKMKYNKRIVEGFVYIYMMIMFLIFYKSSGVNSYGVLPYEFFWN